MSDSKQFFCDYLRQDVLGLLDVEHMALCDWFGPDHEHCLRLAKLHAIAVDFSKKGVPASDYKQKHILSWPDFMERSNRGKEKYESQRALGVLFRDVVASCNEHGIEPPIIDDTPTPSRARSTQSKQSRSKVTTLTQLPIRILRPDPCILAYWHQHVDSSPSAAAAPAHSSPTAAPPTLSPHALLSFARSLYSTYCSRVSSLMQRFDIISEAELMTGLFLSLSPYCNRRKFTDLKFVIQRELQHIQFDLREKLNTFIEQHTQVHSQQQAAAAPSSRRRTANHHQQQQQQQQALLSSLQQIRQSALSKLAVAFYLCVYADNAFINKYMNFNTTTATATGAGEEVADSSTSSLSENVESTSTGSTLDGAMFIDSTKIRRVEQQKLASFAWLLHDPLCQIVREAALSPGE